VRNLQPGTYNLIFTATTTLGLQFKDFKAVTLNHFDPNRITENFGDFQMFAPDIDGNWIVWRQYAPFTDRINNRILAHNIGDPEFIEVAQLQSPGFNEKETTPRINYPWIVWHDWIRDGIGPENEGIFAYNLNTKKNRRIDTYDSSSVSDGFPVIDGETVVWVKQISVGGGIKISTLVL